MVILNESELKLCQGGLNPGPIFEALGEGAKVTVYILNAIRLMTPMTQLVGATGFIMGSLFNVRNDDGSFNWHCVFSGTFLGVVAGFSLDWTFL